MGPIVVLVRRPSLRIPVDPEDVTQELGAIQTIARISSFASEMSSDVTLKGDPPQWVVQVCPCSRRCKLCTANRVLPTEALSAFSHADLPCGVDSSSDQDQHPTCRTLLSAPSPRHD